MEDDDDDDMYIHPKNNSTSIVHLKKKVLIKLLSVFILGHAAYNDHLPVFGNMGLDGNVGGALN